MGSERLRPIGIVTSKPADLAAAKTAGAILIENGNTLTVVGNNGGAAVNLWPLLFYPDGTLTAGMPNGTFWPRGFDRPIASAGAGADFDAQFDLPNGSCWVILMASGATTATAYAVGANFL